MDATAVVGKIAKILEEVTEVVNIKFLRREKGQADDGADETSRIISSVKSKDSLAKFAPKSWPVGDKMPVGERGVVGKDAG